MEAVVSALDVRGLTIERAGRKVVHEASFAAEAGDRVALMGPSGSGKTTVLRAIAGLDPFAAGQVKVGEATLGAGSRRGRDLRNWHRRVGMVFQFHHLFAHMTALHNVWLAPVHAFGRSKAEAEARAHELLAALGVEHRAAAMPHELSGGEAQRVAIARALAVDPPVLLMDEPTASLDPERRTELADTLVELAARGRTILVTTHDVEFARAFARRVVRMVGGRVVAEDAPASLS
jgi:ABC-type polar amino acid transport system ATPase subunit